MTKDSALSALRSGVSVCVFRSNALEATATHSFDCNNNCSHSPQENKLNLFWSCCSGIRPPRGGWNNNQRGSKRKSFHPRHCEMSFSRSAPFRMLPYNLHTGIGESDRMTTARREKHASEIHCVQPSQCVPKCGTHGHFFHH